MRRGGKTKELCVHEGGQFGEGKTEKRKRERKRYRLLKIYQMIIWMNRKETSRVINALEKSRWDMARPGSQQKKGAFKVVN